MGVDSLRFAYQFHIILRSNGNLPLKSALKMVSGLSKKTIGSWHPGHPKRYINSSRETPVDFQVSATRRVCLSIR